jgi:type II secretory pathway predicted ATPase ExeA
MYAGFFGLRELPFNNTPDPRFFYSTPDHEEALASLIYAVKEKKGFVLLTGEIGAGKTLVSRLMIKHFAGTVAFANINHAIRDSADLMESLCAEFELVHEKNAGNAQLVRLLHDFLLAKFAQNTPVVLVLDEAQNLSVEAFEQLRMIGNLEADDAKLLQIVIVGQPELQTLFHSAALRQLRQRLFRSFHLPALSREAVQGYIRHRLTVAGAPDSALFGPASIDAIHQASRGLPRLINTLCDNVMLSAYSADRKTFDIAFVQSVLESIMISAPGNATSAANGLTPARSHPSPDTQTVPFGQQPCGHQSTDQLSAAAERTTVLLKQMETGARRGELVTEQLSTITNRAAQHHQQLLQREHQLTSLLHMMKSSATQLVPLLDQLKVATRNGDQCKESAQSVTRELQSQTAKSQHTINRITEMLHQVRLAEAGATRFASRSSTSHHAQPAMKPKTVPVLKEKTFPVARREVAREASLPRSAVLPANQVDDIFDDARPALRLAQRMEDLAALVHEAVNACTPAGAIVRDL